MLVHCVLATKPSLEMSAYLVTLCFIPTKWVLLICKTSQHFPIMYCTFCELQIFKENYNVSKSYLVLILVVAIFIVNINFLRYLKCVEDILITNKQAKTLPVTCTCQTFKNWFCDRKKNVLSL